MGLSRERPHPSGISSRKAANFRQKRVSPLKSVSMFRSLNAPLQTATISTCRTLAVSSRLLLGLRVWTDAHPLCSLGDEDANRPKAKGS